MSASISDLEKDIEASRARLDRTIDRIQGRLSPTNIVDEMLGTARRAPALDGMYDNALAAVRRNPVPVLLIAAGMGLLFTEMARAGRRRSRAIVPVDTVPLVPTGADRTYDPDLPARRPHLEPADAAQL